MSARLYLSLGQIEEAKNVLSSDLVQKQPEANLLYGRIEAHSGHLAKAERLFCRAAREMPGDPEPVFRQAEILQRRGQDDKSITLLRALSKLDKGNNHRSLADEFKRSFFALEFEKAFWCGERLLDLTTGPERSYAMRWPSLAEEFDLTYAGRLYHERALKLLDHMVAKREYTNWARYYRAIYRRSMFQHRWGEKWGALALDDFSFIRQASPKRYGWMSLEAAKTFLDKGEMKQALRAFQSVVKASQPPYWMALCHVGELYVCLGQKEKALKSFMQAELVAPDISKGDVIAWKGEMLLWMGEYSVALSILFDGVNRGAQYAHGWIGAALLKLGKPEEALGHLDRAVQVSPWDAESRCWRAEALLTLGLIQKALMEANEALRVYNSGTPIFPMVLRGLAYDALGDHRRAAQDLQAIALNVRTEVCRRRGLKSSDVAGVLRAILELSRGARREGYVATIWLGFVP
jgi:tetratricopeptide (TPR) repeat protein